MSTTSFSVNNTLGNSFTVEMGEKVDQMEILEQKRPILARPLRLIWMGLWDAISSRSISI